MKTYIIKYYVNGYKRETKRIGLNPIHAITLASIKIPAILTSNQIEIWRKINENNNNNKT